MKEKGLCFGHPNPDLWYPEMPPGQPGLSYSPHMVALATQIRTAFDICDACPVKETCRRNGMAPENLSFGIWGGLLPGERLAEALVFLSDVGKNSDEGRAINMAIRMVPMVRWEE